MKTDLYRQGVDFLLQVLRENRHLEPSEKSLIPIATQWLEQQNYVVPRKHWLCLRDALVHAVTGFGPLEVWLRDPSVSEIMVNGPSQVFLERAGCLELAEAQFVSEAQLLQVIQRIVSKVGRRIDESQPLVDARLPDGSRVNAIIPPLSLSGPVLTIRKFPTEVFRLDLMLKHGSLNQGMAELLKLLVQQKQNILIAGGTGAGKTSTLNACASLIPKQERLITIEDSAEIKIHHPHLVSLESRPANLEGAGAIGIRDLLKNALRMRPDRIVVGEIRGGEAIDMLQAMNTGHQGSLTTVHANAPLESLYRLETMVLMSDVALPIEAIRPQVKQAIDFVVQQKRLADGTRKITEIAHLKPDLSGPDYQLEVVAFFDSASQKFCASGYLPEVVNQHGSKFLQQWCIK